MNVLWYGDVAMRGRKLYCFPANSQGRYEVYKEFMTLIPSVLERIFIFILFIICRFYIVSETHVGIKIVQTVVIILLISIDPS